MVNNKLKNIIVLKGMASNVVQEAIVILKPNINLEKCNSLEKNKNDITLDRRKSVVQEAEYIIQNYITEIESTNKKIKRKNIEKKYKFSKILNIILGICLIISII